MGYNGNLLRNNRIDKVVFYYYLILLIAYYLLSIPDVEYSITIRIAFFAATLIPALRSQTYLSFALICFYSMTYVSFSPILPTALRYYIPVVLLFYLLYYKSVQKIMLQIIFLLYFYTICTIYDDYNEFITCFFFAIITSSFIKEKHQLDYCAVALMLGSTLLSIMFYTNMDTFYYAYGETHEQDRYGWINPNEYAGAIGCGGVIAVQYLFTKTKELPRWIILLCYLTIITSAIAIVINASRGAAISFALVFILFILFSRIRIGYKLLGIIIVSIGVFLLFRSNVTDFLITRLNESSMATGSGRLDIWASKLEWFLGNASFGEYLFGIGRTACINIPPIYSTHNDFLTAFIGYGAIGLGLIIVMFLYPIVTVHKSHRRVVLFLTLYLFLECMVLEPMFRGYFTFIIFYFYIYKISVFHKKGIK